jgi:hypothetical protein
MLSAAALPGDVYAGRAAVNDPVTGMPTADVMDRAAGLAGLVGTGGMGIEPEMGVGPRVALRSTRQPIDGTSASQFDHNYRMMVNGRDAGRLSLAVDDPADLYVNYVQTAGDQASMPPGTIRALMGQIARQYPDAQTISGYRIGGARTGAAAASPARDVTVRLPPPAASPPSTFNLRDLLAQIGVGADATRPLIDPATGAPQGWPVY